MDLTSKLVELSEEEKKLRADIQVADEQLVFLQEVADEAETRKVVSESPLTDREYGEAKSDLERHERYRQRLLTRLSEIAREKDDLLDRMSGGHGS